MKTFIVYKTTNQVTNEYYIGVHGQVDPDTYLGSGLRLVRSVKKYGKHNFTRETLYEFATEAEAFAKEQELLLTELSNPLNLNISAGGDGGANFAGKRHSEETKARLAELSRSRVLPDAVREAMSEKISAANRQRTPEFWAEVVRNNPEAYYGVDGVKHSSETRDKISGSMTAYYAGRSPEEDRARREKISASMKGRVPWNKKLDCGHIVFDKCSC